MLGNREWCNGCGTSDQVPIDSDAEAVYLCEGLNIGAGKGFERRGRDLGGAVSTVKAVMEEQTDFGDDKGAGNDERSQQVAYSICLQGKDGCLRACENDGLAKVGHHKGQRRGSVGEGVCAVQNDKAVKEVIVFPYAFSHGIPVVGRNGT